MEDHSEINALGQQLFSARSGRASESCCLSLASGFNELIDTKVKVRLQQLLYKHTKINGIDIEGQGFL